MKKTRWINFLGATNLIYSLVVIILLGVAFFLFNQVSYIFTPVLVLFSNILIPSVIALLLYYLFNPLIDFLERHKVKRIISVPLLFLLIIGILSSGIVLLYPVLENQITMFVKEFPSFIESLSASIPAWAENLPFDAEVESFIAEGEKFVSQIPDNINQYLSDGFSGLSSFVSGLTNVVVTLVTFPIILFFLLKDEQRFFRAFLSVAPPKWRQDLIRVSSELNAQVGAYVKGQLIVASSIGIMMFIGFSIIGLKYNGVLAIIAAFTSVIPYIGPALAFLPALIIALIDSWWMVAQLVIVWMVVQFVDGNLIEPNVYGKQLNVHPLTIIIVLLVMGDLLGVFGLIFGVPIYAILKVLVVYVFQKFKKRYNKYYGDVAGEYEVKPIEIAVSGEKKTSNQLKRTIDIAKLKRDKVKDKQKDDGNSTEKSEKESKE
ncbi:MAG: AI-2E family transporter [Alkalibacterium gilvum]|uniref:Predicted PurR-regulated permease PerM n=1 Tax=Alkalibacterium gilvum TaxID=1130080 RepID=A0A1H6SJ29_9LACT|nr:MULTISPECIES: AI-2E family transporter [Alkalibacterium]MDN6293960.1 AI-2E family transporter [Alkalibacterium sp.]MDN6295545.1 AI-2E family transporter [Alkalibacterium sp.]MDN6729643.1 AI-2E family transporter [Alkalibacterium sp.]SEI65904.1 Predicted PurR-regulated permease PerM [Alkalibacterium gilvum]